MSKEDESESGVFITNTEIYREVQALAKDVRDVLPVVEAVKGHAKRIRSLEFKYYALLAGLIAALGIMLKAGS